MSEEVTAEAASTGVFVGNEDYEAVVRAKNSRGNTRFHRPNPDRAEDEDPSPDCFDGESYYPGTGWQFERLNVAVAWWEPCAYCYPELRD